MTLEKHFDQLMHVVRAEIENVDPNVESIEIDLELPRGYVAKPKIIRIRTFTLEANIAATVQGYDIEAALIRDPDDATTIEIPNNEVQHDVITDYKASITYTIDQTNGVGTYICTNPIEFLYLEEAGFDIVTARNMRFNAQCSDAINIDIDVTIWYTLESIKKNEILELLDIL